MKHPPICAAVAILGVFALRPAQAQTPYQEYMRDQMRLRSMAADNEAYEARRAYGTRLIKSGRATTKFQPRPMPVAQLISEWSKTNPGGRDAALAEWKVQSALWQAAVRERGARMNDIADVHALAMVIAHEAYTGSHVRNAGFQRMRQVFREAFLDMPVYQGAGNAEKQSYAVDALLLATDALRLRRGGDVEEAKAQAARFMDKWWTSKSRGVVNTLAPFVPNSSDGAPR